MKIELDKNDLINMIKEKYESDDIQIILKQVTTKFGFSFINTTEFGKILVNIKSDYKTNMKYEDKTKKFDVKLESIDPTGVVVKSEELSMTIVDDQESMINNDRLFIHIGECLYRIDKKGFIIDRVIPHENSK